MEDEEDEDSFEFSGVEEELDPENTEVDDFIVDCLVDGGDGLGRDVTLDWGLLGRDIDDALGGQ